MRTESFSEKGRKVAKIVFKKKGGRYLIYTDGEAVTYDDFRDRAKLIYAKLILVGYFRKKQPLNTALIEKILRLDNEVLDKIYEEKYGEVWEYQTKEDYSKDSEELLAIVQKEYSNAIVYIDEDLILKTIYEYGQLCIEKEEKRLTNLEV